TSLEERRGRDVERLDEALRRRWKARGIVPPSERPDHERHRDEETEETEPDLRVPRGREPVEDDPETGLGMLLGEDAEAAVEIRVAEVDARGALLRDTDVADADVRPAGDERRDDRVGGRLTDDLPLELRAPRDLGPEVDRPAGPARGPADDEGRVLVDEDAER